MQRIAQVTDLHLDHQNAAEMKIDTRNNALRLFNEVKNQGIEELVITGDVAEPTAVEWLLEQLRAFGFRYYLTLGNHDEPADYLAFSGCVKEDGFYYGRETNGASLLFLDSSQSAIGKLQYAWLKNRLDKAGKQIVIFMHHPILDCGDTPMDRLYPLAERDELRDLLSNVDRPITLFCGHYHTADIRQFKNLTQYITPSGFFQIKKTGSGIEVESTQIGYRMITIAADAITTDVVYI